MQAVQQSFHDMAQNSVRPHSWGLRLSFTKEFDEDLSFFTLNSSVLNGNDLLAPTDDNPLQEWDRYKYENFDDRVVSLEWERELAFPYSVQSAMADFTVNNYDGLFTPGGGSPLAASILPKRPVRLFSGFKDIATVQQFVGLTEKMPIVDIKNGTAEFHAVDFLSQMFTLSLPLTVAMSNVTTDQVLDVLFQQFGLLPSQYVLAKGRNVIPFVFFEANENAGSVFRRLMQSEGGSLWIDEQGIIRFEQRLMAPVLPSLEVNNSNVVSIEGSGDGEIINKVVIHSEIRAVQAFQSVWSKADTDGTSNLYIIPANSTKEMEIPLQDPCLSIEQPTLGYASGVSWFTAADAADNPVTTNVSVIASELRVSDYVLTFENTNGFAVEISAADIWGEPAKVVDAIDYEAYDQESVDKYGEQVLEITNDFFGNESNCESFALTIIDAYKDYAGVIELELKGDPSLQLGDIIDVDARGYVGQYKTIKLNNMLEKSKYTQIVKARRYNPRVWFQLDASVLNGGAVLAP